MSSCYNKQTEQTSTSHYKRHLGHCKCLLTSDGDELNQEMQDATHTILQVHSTILNAAIVSKISFLIVS